MSATSPSVSKVAKNRETADAADPGQLDLFADGSWEFTGNGQTSAQDVAASIIDYEKKQAPSGGTDGTGQASDFENVRPEVLAKLLLESPENSELNTQLGGDVSSPIPKPGPSLTAGQTTFRADATSLKQIVGMLMQHEKQLRTGLTVPQKSGESDRLTGNVASNGLTLPYEPN